MKRVSSSGRAVPVVNVDHRLASNGTQVLSLGPGDSAVHEVTMSIISGPSASVIARAEAVKPLRYSGESNHGSAKGNYWSITPAVRLRLAAKMEPHIVEAEVLHPRSGTHVVKHVLNLIFSIGSVGEELFPVAGQQHLGMQVACRVSGND